MIELTQKELCALVGYTYRHLMEVNKKLPDEQKFFVQGTGGKYRLDLFVQRWADYRVRRETTPSENADLKELKAVHEQIKIERSKVELKKLTGELVNAREAMTAWAGVAVKVRQKMLELPAQLSTEIAGEKDVRQIEGILTDEIESALMQLAQPPKLAPEYYTEMETESNEPGTG